MENNTTNTNTQNQPEPNTNTQPGANGKEEKNKMFTQDDVNRIVSERLKEERQRAAEPNQQDAREIELTKRENKLACRDFLEEKEYKTELLEILDTSDVEKFKETVGKLFEIAPGVSKKAVTAVKLPGGRPQGINSSDDLIANAFKPNI
ncbi:MAG: hypothetical protein IJ285_06095 [Clostridia bacterium]|nr:hypothetical protein [Clostridia bacterium]